MKLNEQLSSDITKAISNSYGDVFVFNEDIISDLLFTLTTHIFVILSRLPKDYRNHYLNNIINSLRQVEVYFDKTEMQDFFSECGISHVHFVDIVDKTRGSR